MGSSILNIGISGLNAAQAGLITTGHNISNASTAGFSRQQIIQTTNTPQFSGAGFLGQGTNVETVRRVFNQFVADRLSSAQTRASELTTYSDQIQQIDNLLADPSAGLSPALQSFFSGVQGVASSPSQIPARQSMLSAAQALVSRFQDLDARLTEIRSGVNAQITSSITEINSYSKQIADINQRILLAQAGGTNQQPNDLLDQRNQLIAELNKQIRVSTTTEVDGSFNIFIGNGQPLVVSGQNFNLVARPDQYDPTRVSIGYQSGSKTIDLPESVITGGTLGGLLAFRSETLDGAQNAVGRVAIGLAQTFNDQHRLGQDLTGNLGGDFFEVATPVVLPSSSNAGSATVSAQIADVSALTTSDYRLDFDGSNYTITRLSDNTASGPYAALPQTVDGVTIDISAPLTAAEAGNTYLIEPTRKGASDIGMAISDPREIAAAAPIRSKAATTNTGSATITPGSVNPPPPPDANLTQAVTITFTSPTTFDVTGTGAGLPATGVAYTSGSDITYNGWTVQISGAPATGDTFAVEQNAGGVSDNRNALLLGKLQTTSTLIGGTASYQSAYSQLVSGVGNKAREIQVTGNAQDNIVRQAEDAQQAVSGVNLDEEAANLIRYQQAYQAAGKVIEIATKLFDTLLQM